jgi:hypothetical protein
MLFINNALKSKYQPCQTKVNVAYHYGQGNHNCGCDYDTEECVIVGKMAL